MWEISGEAGKALDGTLRDSHDLASDVRLRYESLEADEVTWSVRAKLGNFSDLLLPELGQKVEVWRDGDRQFSGIVTGLPATVTGGEISGAVTAEGPHWWLEKTPFTESVQDDDATAQDRAAYVFAEGDLKDHIEAIFARAAAVGLPVGIGAIADCFEAPQMTVSNQSFAEVLGGIVRLIPDAICWWDYDVAGVPKFRLSRRGTAAVLGLTYGQAPLVSASLRPRLGLEAKEVVVQYAERDGNGGVLFREQSSGSGGIGTRQVVVTSGEELSEYLPDDPPESVELTSVDAFSVVGGNNPSAIEEFWEFWKDWQARFTIPGFAIPVVRRWGANDPDSAAYSDGTQADYRDDGGGLITNSSGRLDYLLTVYRDELPEWVFEALDIVEVGYEGTLYIKIRNQVGQFPDWMAHLTANADFVHTTSDATYVTYFCYFNVALDLAGLDDPDGPFNATTFQKPGLFEFNSPPANFAAEIRGAQSFVPFDGRVDLAFEIAPGNGDLGKVLNIAGALPSWTAMKALIQGVETRLSDGSQVLRLGAPQRVSFDDIASRLRVDPRDNIVLL